MNYRHKKLIKLSSLVFSVAAVLISCASNTHLEFTKPLRADDSEQPQQLEIHTLSLLNKRHGDCTIVSYGDTQVMIDCGGSQENSKDVIYNALKEYVKDGILEYVVISHGDDDHVSNFTYGGAMDKWLNEEKHSINFLIDFDMTRDDSLKGKYANLPSIINKSSEYLRFVKEKETAMKIRHHLSSSMCTYKSRGIDSKSDVFDSWKTVSKFSAKKYITDTYPLWFDTSESNKIDKITPLKDSFDMSSSSCRLKILYNYFYDHGIDYGDESKEVSSADYNVLSTCVMIEMDTTYGDPIRALFTGDLEEYDSEKGYKSIAAKGESLKGGESLLLKYNKKSFNTPITYYKAAHHGSNTSNSPSFLEYIRPVNIAIPCCADGQYGFPSASVPTSKNDMHAFSTVVEMSNYTDHIYITDALEIDEDSGEEKIVPYYGDINFFATSNSPYTFSFGNESMKKVKSIFATDWYKSNRLFNAQVYNLTNSTHSAIDCTYIKIGSVDILIGAGCDDTQFIYGANEITSKINKLCNDHILDYLIVPTSYISSWQYLYGKNSSYKYVLSGSNIKRIKNFIYYNSNNLNDDYANFLASVNQLSGEIQIDRLIASDYLNPNLLINGKFEYGFDIDFDGISIPGYYIRFLEYEPDVLITNNGVGVDIKKLSMYTLVSCGTFKYLNMGNDYSYGFDDDGNNKLITYNPDIAGTIHLLQVPYFGYNDEGNNQKLVSFYNSVGINHNVVTLGGADDGEYSDKTKMTPRLFLNTMYGKSNGEKLIYPINGKDYIKGSVYATKKIVDNTVLPFRGDICARISLLKNRIFYFRFRKTNSLSNEEFNFYKTDANGRSDVGRGYECSYISEDEMASFNV